MIVRSLTLLVLTASMCARAPAPLPTSSAPGDVGFGASPATPAPSSLGDANLKSASAPAVAASGPADALVAPTPTPEAQAAPAPSASSEQALPDDGEDFIAQARTLFRVAACGTLDGAAPDADLPAGFDSAVVARHCGELSQAYSDYQKAWVSVAQPFITTLRPKDLPRAAVYPFGGGDLASALATFPDATEITTISLEPAGDVRAIDKLAPDRLARELAEHRSHLERLFAKAHSRTDNLEKESKTELPGEILFALAALVIFGDEPVALRYFRLRPDGSIAYVTQADLRAARGPVERRALFAHAELRFRHAGAAGAPVRVLRHLSYNLDDSHLTSDPALLAHLTAKGKVAAMTKAASHLLWNDQFSKIRGWLLDHTDWMISDSTGIPPRFAAPAGFLQDTYGTFNGPAPFGLLNPRDAADVKRLFSSQPLRDLPFRYGYPDKDGHGHLIITRRRDPAG